MDHDAGADRVRAFEQLVRPLIAPAYRLAYGMLHQREEAEDAVQEATFRAWRKFDTFRQGTQMRPWFFAIVANECRTVRSARWWSVLKRADVAMLDQRRPDEDAIRSADVRQALRGLSDGERLAVVLHFYLDLPFDEVAAIIGTSVEAVKSRTYRAVRKLAPAVSIGEVVT